LTIAEYWRISPNIFTFAIAVGLKPFGGFPFNFSIPRVDRIHEVEWDDLPPVVTRQFKDPVRQFERAGFNYLFAYELPLLERNRLGMAAVLISKDALTFATVNYAQDPTTHQRQCNCVSVFDDTTKGVTTTAKKMMKPHPQYRTQRHPEAQADVLSEHHKQHLAERDEEFSIRPIRLDAAAVREAVLDGEQGHVDFNIERRVYIPMSKEEIRKIRDVHTDDDD